MMIRCVSVARRVLGLLFKEIGRIPGRIFFTSMLSLFLMAGSDQADTSPIKATPSEAQSTSSPAVTASPLGSGGKYALGTVIRFGTGGGSEAFRQSGWSATEPNATWTTGSSAKLAFLIESPEQPLTLRMSLAALSGMTNPATPTPQPVEVVANGQKIADWEVTTRSDFNAVIPASIVKNGGALVIELKTPKAVSPKAMGISEDARVLGVYCFELAITKGG
jgi:hypothetical protein